MFWSAPCGLGSWLRSVWLSPRPLWIRTTLFVGLQRVGRAADPARRQIPRGHPVAGHMNHLARINAPAATETQRRIEQSHGFIGTPRARQDHQRSILGVAGDGVENSTAVAQIKLAAIAQGSIGVLPGGGIAAGRR